MHFSKLISQTLALVLVITFFLAPVAAQKRAAPVKKPAPAPVEPALTFDTLLTDDSYKVYGEIRNIGQFVRSAGFNELVDPLMKLREPPREVTTLLKWLGAHAEAVASSRMFVAAWPTRPRLPEVLIAVDFATADEAKKFDADLRGLMPKLMAKPSPSPAGSPAPQNLSTATAQLPPAAPAAQSEAIAGTPPSYAIKQMGTMVLLTDKPFLVRELKPRRSKLLFEDANFALARNRFASEPVFLYVDVKAFEKEQQEQQKKWDKENEESARKEVEAVQTETAKPGSTEITPEKSADNAGNQEPVPSDGPEQVIPTDPPAAADSPEVIAARSPELDIAMMSIWSLIFSGQPKWPEAIGVALAFEDEGYVLRALVVNGPEAKPSAFPFVTQLASGPPIAITAPNVIPAEIDLFVSLSLDYPQMYEATIKTAAGLQDLSRRIQPQLAAATEPESPYAPYEKKIGLKLKDDVLPLLGHELAIGLLTKQPAPSPSPNPVATPSPEDGPTAIRAPDFAPVIAVALKDKEAVRRLIPKIIDGLAVKGASLLAHSEKKEGTEIISYAGMFSYAFIEDFLIVSPDAVSTRRAVDSYLNHKTLASNSDFKNATRWQPRAMQGQLYAGPGLIDLYNPLGDSAAINDKMMGMVGQLNPVINPLTYAISNDGTGQLHELHLPRNLLLLMVAGIMTQPNESPIFANESIAQAMLRTLSSAETSFQSTTGKGQYGTLEELEKAGFLSKDMFEKNGYKVEVSASANKFEATATPVEYGKTGKRSFFIDESGVLRGGDHAGGAATISDKPVE